MNIKNRLISALTAVIISTAYLPLNGLSAETHTVTVFDYDGGVMAVLTVPHGETPDLSVYENSDKLNFHQNDYTQVGFSQWSDLPVAVSEDISVYALFVKMTIECIESPYKTEYFSDSGKINISGLKVIITKYTQIPEKDENNAFITDVEITDISDGCTAVPETLEEAFSNENNSSVKIIPPNGNRAIVTYNINYFENLGDANGDNSVDASDASKVLEYYAMLSTGGDLNISEQTILICDIDRNGAVDSSDASEILAYYSANSTTSEKISWDDFLT